MQPQRILELGNCGRRQLSNALSEASDIERSDLLGLRFRRARQAGYAVFEERLKGQDACQVRRHRYDRHHTTAETGRPRICAVIADDDSIRSLPLRAPATWA
jgi:hypothetical protein